MIENFKVGNKKECYFLTEFITNNINYDFYYAHENARVYITDYMSLKNLLRQSNNVYQLKERDTYVGVILTWKSVGGGKERHYVKVCAKNEKVANDLLTVLLWNTKTDLFVKIRKDSKFINVFRRKGFKFKGGRGIQILLHRKYKPIASPKYIKNED